MNVCHAKVVGFGGHGYPNMPLHTPLCRESPLQVPFLLLKAKPLSCSPAPDTGLGIK